MSCSFARWLCSLPASVLCMLVHALFLFLLPTLVSPLFWLRTAGKVGWEFPCPYLLNFPFYCVNTSYLVNRCRITTHWLAGSLNKGEFLRTLGTLRVNPVKAKLAPFKGITPCAPPTPLFISCPGLSTSWGREYHRT